MHHLVNNNQHIFANFHIKKTGYFKGQNDFCKKIFIFLQKCIKSLCFICNILYNQVVKGGNMTDFEIFTREEVTRLLLELGVPANLQGFRCLQQCIMKVIEDASLLRKVTKNLYPLVGKEFAIAGSVVERSMRHSTDIGFYKTGFKPLCKLYNMKEQRWGYKPTNSELIALIAEYVRIKAEKNGIMPVNKDD